MSRPPPPPSGQKQGTTPPCFQSQKVCFAWSVRRTGEGGLPLRLRSGVVGYSVDGVGVPPAARIRRTPPSPRLDILLCRPPPPRSGTNGEGWGSYAEAGGIPLVCRSAKEKNCPDRPITEIGPSNHLCSLFLGLGIVRYYCGVFLERMRKSKCRSR